MSFDYQELLGMSRSELINILYILVYNVLWIIWIFFELLIDECRR